MNSLVAEIMNALKKEERVKTLELLAEGYTLTEITKELEMSFAGVQNYYNAFEETNLVEEVDGEKQVTAAGKLVLDWLNELSDELEGVERDMAYSQYERVKKEFEGKGIKLPSFEDVYQDEDTE